MKNLLIAVLISASLALQGCGGCDDNATRQNPDVGGDDQTPGLDPQPDVGVQPDVAAPPDLGPDGPIADGPSGDGIWTGDGPSGDAALARECVDVEPPAGSIGQAVLLLVTGDGFDLGGTQIELVESMPCSGACDVYPLSPVAVANLDGDSDGEQASATIAPNTLPQGYYDVFIITSGQTLRCGFYSSSANAPPTVAKVVADSASAGSDRLVTITGTGFLPTPTVRFRLISDPAQFFDATQVDFGSATDLTVLVPSNSLAMPLGAYHVFVRNPDLVGAQWCPTDGICIDADMDGLADNPGVFTVTPLPPPDIFDVVFISDTSAQCDGSLTPRVERQCCTDGSTPLKITGQDFDPAATIALVVAPGSGCPGGTTPNPDDADVCILSAACTVCTAIEIQISMPDCSQNIYGVRVTNPDNQFDSFFVVEITSSADGHINGSWDDAVNQTELVCGRERHAAVSGKDQTGGSHMWVVGGVVMDDPGELEVCGGTTPVRQAADTVERAAVSVFGTAGPWSVSEQYQDPANPRVPNRLTTPRTGLAAVRFGRRIYAIGGADTDTRDPAVGVPALDTVEAARILDWEGRPLVAAPSFSGATQCDPATEGCLPGGTWFYRVSAISASDGESLGSVEASRRNVGGRLRLCWLPVAGATSYNVYRSLAEDGRSQSTRLLVAEPAVAGMLTAGQIATVNVGGASMVCFLDNGGDLTATGGPFLVPAPGRLRGTVQAGGTLGDMACAADVTYRYRVQAAVQNSLAATNTTLAGYEASLTIRDVEECAAGLRTVQLNWDALEVAGTGSSIVEYRVYRDQIPADPDPTRMGLLAVVPGPSPPAFTDDGGVAFADANASPPGGFPTLPAGSLSRWAPLVEPMSGLPVTLTVPREGADSVIVTIEDRAALPGADRSFVFISGGRTDNAAGGGNYLTTTERLELGADSVPLAQTFQIVTAPGTATPVDFTAPRAFFPLLTNNEHDEPAVPSDPCPNPDADGDGFISCLCPGGNDCDDTNANIHPGAGEICGNGIDEDCSGGCGVVDDLPCGTPPDMGVVPDGAEPPPDLGPPPDGAEPPPDGPQADVPGCLDNDGDGHENPGCGGDDCNDNDATICPTCPEILCDGIDQDCDFIDPPCSPPPWRPGDGQGDSHLGSIDLTYLIAQAGDDLWDGPTTNGRPATLVPFEYCLVDDDSTDDAMPGAPQIGDIVCGTPTVWDTQDDNPGTTNFAHDGILYADFIYMFGGTATESDVGEPAADGNSYRWQFCENPADCGSGTPIDNQRQNAGANFTPGRAYYALVRAASKLWVIGGNEGAGPVSTVLRHGQ